MNRGPQAVFGMGGFRFLGLMRGHWDLPLGVQVGQAEAVNMGISIVVPAKKILETLYHPELVALRDKQDELRKKRWAESPVPKCTEFCEDAFRSISPV
jgi:hypothetical protein